MAKCGICGKSVTMAIVRYYCPDEEGKKHDVCKECQDKVLQSGKALKYDSVTQKLIIVDRKDIEIRKKCNNCLHVFCYTPVDLDKNKKNQQQAMWNSVTSLGGAMSGNHAAAAVYSQSAQGDIDRIVDYNKCPRCGSIDLTRLSIEEYRASLAGHNSSNNNALQIQTSSSADELIKYKNLLDMGAITEDEFNAKKAELLNLPRNTTSTVENKIDFDTLRLEEERRAEEIRRVEEARKAEEAKRIEEVRKAEEAKRAEEERFEKIKKEAEARKIEAERIAAENKLAEERAFQEKLRKEAAEKKAQEEKIKAEQKAFEKSINDKKNSESVAILSKMVKLALIVFASVFIINTIAAIIVSTNIVGDIFSFIFFVVLLVAVPFILACVSLKTSYAVEKLKVLLRTIATIIAIAESVLFAIVAIAMFAQSAFAFGFAFLTVVAVSIIVVIFLSKSKKI